MDKVLLKKKKLVCTYVVLIQRWPEFWGGLSSEVYLLFQLISLSGQPLDLWFKTIHVAYQHSIVLRLALYIDLQLALALRNVH